ncbi:MAG: hypothetical protein J0I88_00315 [Chryseobacterium sp.]|nr:hypothetical protein [Chryseobacterium sp.]OJX31046.1 MAG: hypothetical protein BGO86_01290 [Chryseobacterium sp. 36-9]
MNKAFFLILITLLFVSCVPSYRISHKIYKEAKPSTNKAKAFVINKELKKEYKILEKSQIYELVEDDSYQVKIKLDSMKTTLVCGNGMAGSMLTFGLLPSSLPDEYYYGFQEIGDENKKFEFNLQVIQSLWLFNMFYPKGFSKQAGKALLASYQERNK